MSVDRLNDSGTETKNSFAEDAEAVQQIAAQAFVNMNQGDGFDTQPGHIVHLIEEFRRRKDISAETAIAGAWFFILEFEVE